MIKTCPQGKILNPKTNRCVKDKSTKKVLTSVKSCPQGKILNPKTNRCVKDRSTKKVVTSIKTCPEGKILNPKTNRCVKDRSTKKVVNSVKTCPEGKILNPKTNRCVKDRSSKTSKSYNSLYPKKVVKKVVNKKNDVLLEKIKIWIKYLTNKDVYSHRYKKRIHKEHYNELRTPSINNLSLNIPKCNKKIPIIDPPKTTNKNGDMISILGPIGLSYIHYKDTKILLFPELHAYGTDEDKLKSYDKSLIKIEDIMDSYITSNLCVDVYHEGIRYRQREYYGGSSESDRYAKFISTEDLFGIDAYNHNRYSNTMVHYTEFRNAHSSDYIIWDFLQTDSYKLKSPLAKKNKIPRNISQALYVKYLGTPYKLVKLAEAYYLEDDFQQAINNLLPKEVVDIFFDFSSIKKFRGKWMHPIRKQILKYSNSQSILNFIQKHINNLLNGSEAIGDELVWYFEQSSRKDMIGEIRLNINNKTNYIDNNIEKQWFLAKELNSDITEILNKNFISDDPYNWSILDLYSNISLYLGDLLVDTYTLSRMLRYIDERNTNVVMFYGGWSHPYTIHRYFREESIKNVKFMKEYGRHVEIGHFDQNEKSYNDYRRKYSFNMSYLDFNKIFDIDIKKAYTDQYINLEDYKFKMNKDDGYIKK